jgi:protein-S-isoprenylcysteine O-methyltransferase Ste14
LKQKHFIDSHKGATAFAILGLMAFFDQWENTTAWIYLALHGSYGMMWVLKSRIFPDRSWERRTGLPYGLFIWAALSLYWIAPYLITAQGIQAPLWWICVCVSMYALGVFMHFGSDMQKHTSLALRPGLITTGLWARCRNPNYFGELLIYLGFGLLPMHWAPVTALFAMVLALWVPNMRRKDKSLSRYPEFAAYKKQSTLFIPFVI